MLPNLAAAVNNITSHIVRFHGLTVMTADSDSASEGSTPSETYPFALIDELVVVGDSSFLRDAIIKYEAISTDHTRRSNWKHSTKQPKNTYPVPTAGTGFSVIHKHRSRCQDGGEK
jgi:hypothetical protein